MSRTLVESLYFERFHKWSELSQKPNRKKLVLKRNNFTPHMMVYVCVRFQIIKLKWYCQLSKIKCTPNRWTYVWHVHNDRYHRLCFRTVDARGLHDWLFYTHQTAMKNYFILIGGKIKIPTHRMSVLCCEIIIVKLKLLAWYLLNEKETLFFFFFAKTRSVFYT